jgi:arabinose-5-phosphate isomerase
MFAMSLAPKKYNKSLGQFRSIAIDSLQAQSDALQLMASRIGNEFDAAVDLILSSKGRTIISGMGKSGLVGKKMAATFASTGTPSFFIHPAEAFHGDLGMITSDDLLILISYSGETEEVTKLLPSLNHFDCRIISMVGNPESKLGLASDVVLNVAVEREVCPNNLAPTTSTMATMGMGDALAVALINARNFKPVDFARYHPGGSLGKRLLTRVRDVMCRDIPIVKSDTTVHECIFTMTSGRHGLAVVMDGDTIRGIITDGDLRRAMLKDQDFMNKAVIDFANHTPITVSANCMLSEAEEIMRDKKLKALIVTSEREDDQAVCGILEIFN